MRGFSLLEVLVATSLVAVGVSALAHLAVLGGHANLHARQTTIAAVLAQQKMEDLVADAAAATLTESPAGTLASTVAGYADFTDLAGRVLSGGPTPPADAAFLRRWAVAPMPGSPGHSWIMRVLVTDLRHPGAADARLAAAAAKAF